MQLFLALLAIVAIWSSVPTLAKDDFTYHRSCVFSRWAHLRGMVGEYDISNVYEPGICTHIYYAYVFLDFDDLSLVFLEEDMELGETGLVSQTLGLREVDPDLTVILSVCEWEYVDPANRRFAKMISTAENRETFIGNLVDFVAEYKFDGIDIDWEFPNGPEEAANYVLFIQELRAAIGDMILTVSVSANIDVASTSYDIPAINEVVDFVNVMTFENSFPDSEYVTRLGSALYPPTTPGQEPYNVVDSVQYWLDNGVPSRKLILGIPTYMEGWTLADPAVNGVGAPATGMSVKREIVKEPGFSSFLSLCRIEDADFYVFDEERVSEYMVVNGDQWFSGDWIPTIEIKLDWLKEKELGGAFIWLLDYDDWTGKCPDSNGQVFPVMRQFKKQLA